MAKQKEKPNKMLDFPKKFLEKIKNSKQLTRMIITKNGDDVNTNTRTKQKGLS